MAQIMEHAHEKTCLGFPTRSDINQVVQPQKRARGLKVRIKSVEGLNNLCSEKRMALISCVGLSKGLS